VSEDGKVDALLTLSSPDAIGEDAGASSLRCLRTFIAWMSNLSTRTMALCTGLKHKLAGPGGGVLGVIPAVQLHNNLLAANLLGKLLRISSAQTMGIFLR
jgi:hypothetical protein